MLIWNPEYQFSIWFYNLATHLFLAIHANISFEHQNGIIVIPFSANEGVKISIKKYIQGKKLSSLECTNGLFLSFKWFRDWFYITMSYDDHHLQWNPINDDFEPSRAIEIM